MKKLMLLGCSVLLLAIPSTGDAQVAFGPQLSWGSDSDIGVGGRAVIGIPQFRTGLELHVSGDYFFLDCGGSTSEVDCSWIEFNANAALPVPLAENLNTYVGAGLNVTRVKVDVGPFGSASNTEIGINVLGGLKFPMGGMTPFTEARFTIGGSEQFVLTVGLLFGGGAR
ncbi:hypothetical protein BH23GEM9_BH23GEM9_28790 [soil metagenome]